MISKKVLFTKKILYLIFGIFLILLIFNIKSHERRKMSKIETKFSQEKLNIKINNSQFEVEIARTEFERQIGLSGKSEINESEGMVFMFDRPDRACFWMKDMKFNLDILWFDTDQKLIFIQKNLSPESYPNSYCPPKNAQFVVELLPGKVDPKLGDRLEIQKQK